MKKEVRILECCEDYSTTYCLFFYLGSTPVHCFQSSYFSVVGKERKLVVKRQAIEKFPFFGLLHKQGFFSKYWVEKRTVDLSLEVEKEKNNLITLSIKHGSTMLYGERLEFKKVDIPQQLILDCFGNRSNIWAEMGAMPVMPNVLAECLLDVKQKPEIILL